MTDTSTASLPPAAGLSGHARVRDQQNSSLGGPNRITLYGTPEAPQLYASSDDMFSGVSMRPRREDLALFAREILAFLGEDNGITLPPWRPACNGAGRRRWFLIRGTGAESDRIQVADRYRLSVNGDLIRYVSAETAQRTADRLNMQERKTGHLDDSETLEQIRTVLASATSASEALTRIIVVMRRNDRIKGD